MDDYFYCLSHHRQRVIGEVRSVEDVAELQQLVSWCSLKKKTFSVFSAGCSWGLGSRLPAKDVDMLIDLGSLDEIRDIDLGKRPYATIETGVSQGKLCQSLRGSSVKANLTSAGPNAGVLSNALERGLGFLGPKESDIIGLEVITPEGKMMRLGMNWEGDKIASHFNPTIGPDYQSSFFQSNTGIVTAAGIKLRIQPPCAKFIIAEISSESMAEATGFVSDLSWQGSIDGVPKFLSATTLEGYRDPGSLKDSWILIAPIFGEEAIVDFRVARVLDKIKTSSIKMTVEALSIESVYGKSNALGEACSIYLGKPSGDSVKAIIKTDNREADRLSQNGILFSVYTAAMSDEYFSDLQKLRLEIYKRTKVVMGVTINVIFGEYYYTNFMTVFPREEIEADRAHRSFDLLYDLALAAKWFPHRLDIDRQIRGVSRGETPLDMKNPERANSKSEMLSPGRYGSFQGL